MLKEQANRNTSDIRLIYQEIRDILEEREEVALLDISNNLKREEEDLHSKKTSNEIQFNRI
jgi:hypothetical protein